MNEELLENTIQCVFSYKKSIFDIVDNFPNMSQVQVNAIQSICMCRTPHLGYTVKKCENCETTKVVYDSCHNRSCPQCQALDREIWIDKKQSEMLDMPYFHIVFTTPHQLNPLFLANQRILYGLLHKCSSQTILELCNDEKYLGATPAIIQILHTWNQELLYHPHIHMAVSSGGLTNFNKLKIGPKKFFIPLKVLATKFRGKFLANLKELYNSGNLEIPKSCEELNTNDCWQSFIDELYTKDWLPYIKRTCNGNGNAIEYFGRYANRIAISNNRIINVTSDEVTFSARGLKPGEPKREITLSHYEFIHRYLLHVLPKGFQKIRYHGILSNRWKKKYFQILHNLKAKFNYTSRFAGMTKEEIVKEVWGYDCNCPKCGGKMNPVERCIMLHGMVVMGNLKIKHDDYELSVGEMDQIMKIS